MEAAKRVLEQHDINLVHFEYDRQVVYMVLPPKKGPMTQALLELHGTALMAMQQKFKAPYMFTISSAGIIGSAPTPKQLQEWADKGIRKQTNVCTATLFEPRQEARTIKVIE